MFAYQTLTGIRFQMTTIILIILAIHGDGVFVPFFAMDFPDRGHNFAIPLPTICTNQYKKLTIIAKKVITLQRPLLWFFMKR